MNLSRSVPSTVVYPPVADLIFETGGDSSHPCKNSSAGKHGAAGLCGAAVIPQEIDSYTPAAAPRVSSADLVAAALYPLLVVELESPTPSPRWPAAADRTGPRAALILSARWVCVTPSPSRLQFPVVCRWWNYSIVSGHCERIGRRLKRRTFPRIIRLIILIILIQKSDPKKRLFMRVSGLGMFVKSAV